MPVPVTLTLPTMPSNADYSQTATFLAGTSSAISSAAMQFLNDLASYAAIEFSQVGDLPNFQSVVWLGQSAAVLDRPTRPTLELGNINDLLAQLRALVAPTAPTEEFSYTDPGYASSLRQTMIDKLLYDMVNGGYGIDTNDEIALWNRTRDREELSTQVGIAEVSRQAAATGFQMPQGALYVAIQKARQDKLSKLNSINREITLEKSKLFVENRARVLSQVLESETQSISLYNAIQARTLESAKVRVQLAIALFDAGIRIFEAQIKGITDQIAGQLDAARATAQIYAADVSAYAAFVNAVVSGAQIDIANSKNILTRDIAAHESRVEIVKFRLEQLKTTLAKNIDIDKSGIEFFRTGFGAAVNGVNGLAVQNNDV